MAKEPWCLWLREKEEWLEGKWGAGAGGDWGKGDEVKGKAGPRLCYLSGHGEGVGLHPSMTTTSNAMLSRAEM